VAKGESIHLLPELEHGLVERPSLAPQQLCFAHLEGLELALEGLPALHDRRSFSRRACSLAREHSNAHCYSDFYITVPCQAVLLLVY